MHNIETFIKELLHFQIVADNHRSQRLVKNKTRMSTPHHNYATYNNREELSDMKKTYIKTCHCNVYNNQTGIDILRSNETIL
ncbi:MAG: hypothetical protein DRG78_00340 [Epsilonproteobacteria bacterium]|nr:MAG: hypothetical protein DRG78_00340 [Campylobacterota bacterium]